MWRFRLLIGLTIVTAFGTVVIGEDSELPAPAVHLYREAMVQLRGVRLAASQESEIRRLASKYGVDLQEAQRQAVADPVQRKQHDAVSLAAQHDLRGSRLRDLLHGAPARTAEQQAAFQRAARLRLEFEQGVGAVLTAAQLAELRQPAKRNSVASGFLIIQLAPGVPEPPRTAQTLDDAATALDLPTLHAVLTQFHLTKSERAINPHLLDLLAAKKNDGVVAEIRRLRAFWQIDVTDEANRDHAGALVALQQLPEIAQAYEASVPTEPAACWQSNPFLNPDFFRQQYLHAAPAGINAPAAWKLSGGQGGGVGLVDFERGWNINHEDLRYILNPPIFGDIMPGNDHGTSVLGQIVAQDNSLGIIGAAPCVDYVAQSSWYNALTSVSNPGLTATAMIVPQLIMNVGDVLLIELECGAGLPAESEPLYYSAIRLAVALGIVVVEPAGNGGLDLDAFLWNGKPVLNRHSNYFRDSGAIMVGASDPLNGHNKAGASCYGSRVDCFGWGNYVTTTSRHSVTDLLAGSNDDNSYRWAFNGTSSAAPIIAGAAVLVQGLWKTHRGVSLSSVEMRKILSNPLTGTPQGTVVPGHIGVMPDLGAILAANGIGSADSRDHSLRPSVPPNDGYGPLPRRRHGRSNHFQRR